jgi:uncharacterized membrane protein YidH (DUF202 family)
MNQVVIRLAAFAVLLVSLPAHAYVGPGAGLSAIGVVLALIGALFLMIAGFVWYPVKRLLKRRERPPADIAAEPADAEDSELPPQPNRPQSEQM